MENGLYFLVRQMVGNVAEQMHYAVVGKSDHVSVGIISIVNTTIIF